MQDESQSAPGPRTPTLLQANYTLAVCLIAYVLSFVDRQILSLLVGPIRKDLAISDFQMSLLQGAAFAIFYVALGLPIGRLADLARRNLIISTGVFLWSAMTVSCGFATSFLMLFLSRIGVGVGEAALSPSAYSLLTDSFPKDRLVRALGIYTMGTTIGGGLAFVIGGSVIALISQIDVSPFQVLAGLKPWQLTFIIVGAPGLLVGLLALTLREPPRRGLAELEQARNSDRPSFGEVLGYIWRRRGLYAPIYFSVSSLSIVGYGTLNWYPTFLIRTYGMTAKDVGLYFGLIYLVFGTLGAIGGARLSEYLSRRGRVDAHLRVVMLIALALFLPTAIGPLSPSRDIALMVAVPMTFLLGAYFGASLAALQTVTPNQMRALNSAIYLLVSTLAGLCLGASLVAALTDFVFHDDKAIRYSLMVVCGVACPLAALIAAAGLKRYAAAVKEAEAWR